MKPRLRTTFLNAARAQKPRSKIASGAGGADRILGALFVDYSPIFRMRHMRVAFAHPSSGSWQPSASQSRWRGYPTHYVSILASSQPAKPAVLRTPGPSKDPTQICTSHFEQRFRRKTLHKFAPRILSNPRIFTIHTSSRPMLEGSEAEAAACKYEGRLRSLFKRKPAAFDIPV